MVNVAIVPLSVAIIRPVSDDEDDDVVVSFALLSSFFARSTASFASVSSS